MFQRLKLRRTLQIMKQVVSIKSKIKKPLFRAFSKNYFTASFNALPALNAGTLLAGISISLPV